MSKILLDYDPINGVACNLEFKSEGDRQVMNIIHEQDVTHILDMSKSLANNEGYTQRGIKDDQWHYARIPYLILQEMKTKHHADWQDKNDHGHKRFFRVLNEHYPAFKTTHWNHE
jgi:hypothetical protein